MFKRIKRCIAVVVVFCFALYPQSVSALPQNPVIPTGGGTATFDTTVANELTVNQTSQRLYTNWDSFSIGLPETVTFNQSQGASSIALNRVVGVDPSAILGKLTANGRVFLVNPNGILFGSNSVVDTAGILASTLDIDMSVTDFVNGTGDDFSFTGPGGSVINYGEISLNAPGGYAALIGSRVKNIGLIEVELGKVILAAGEAMTLNLDPAGAISLAVNITQGTDRNDENKYAAVNNVNFIDAEGSKVILSADILNDAFDSAVNNDGIIEAMHSAQGPEGLVLLESNQNIELNGTIVASGAIDAFADENIIIGKELEDLIFANYVWKYLGTHRSYKLKEFGYYYDGGTLEIALSQGENIGIDPNSPTQGYGALELEAVPDGLYTIFDPLSGDWLHYYEEDALNPDGLQHVKIKNGTEYWWEDMLNQGDKDFNDAIIDFNAEVIEIPAPEALLDAPSIFLTADNGSITQHSGEIRGDYLMLESNTGVSGIGSNGGIETRVQVISALNKSSGHFRLSNLGNDLQVNNFTWLPGLNTDVRGRDGVVNCAVGGEVNIEALEGEGADLDIYARIHSYGPVILLAQYDIRQASLFGDITIHNPYMAPGSPINLVSPSHVVGETSTDRTVDVEWQLPENIPGYGLLANAGGEYEMHPDSSIKTQGGNVEINSGDDVKISMIDARNGNVKVTASSGWIIDADGGSAPFDYDVIARNIKLVALNGTVGQGDAIDLGYPYDFSYVWDNAAITEPDIFSDPYTSSYDEGTGDWTFANTSEELANGSWWFHVNTLDYPVQDYSPCEDGGCGRQVLAKKVELFTDEVYEGPSNIVDEGCGEEIIASLAAHIGPFIFGEDTPPEETGFWEEFEEFRVYYEILDPSRFLAFEPATKIGLYAYHPLTPTDLSAFDEIELDEDAYEFIDDNIKVKKPAAPYFGL